MGQFFKYTKTADKIQIFPVQTLDMTARISCIVHFKHGKMGRIHRKNESSQRDRRFLEGYMRNIKNYPLIVKLFFSLALFIIASIFIISLVSNYIILHFSENEIGKSGIGKLKVVNSLAELPADEVNKDALRLSGVVFFWV